MTQKQTSTSFYYFWVKTTTKFKQQTSERKRQQVFEEKEIKGQRVLNKKRQIVLKQKVTGNNWQQIITEIEMPFICINDRKFEGQSACRFHE